VAVAVFGVLMLAALTAQIVLLQAQLGTVRDQREIAERQARDSKPLLRTVRPLASDVRDSLPAAARLGRRADALLRQATPLVADLRSVHTADTLRGVSLLTDVLLRSDVGGATRSVRAIADALAETTRRDLPRKADQATADVAEVLRLQRTLLRLQRQSLAVQRTSLAIQRSTEAHAASLDAKTGGQAPPVALDAGAR
jgi:hypothetical protein